MTGHNPYGSNYLRMLEGLIQQENYSSLLEHFLRLYSRSLSLPKKPTIIIAPEYIRGSQLRPGVQLVVLDPTLAQEIRRRFHEWPPPVWIRVRDNRGRWVDININDAQNGLENRRYVEQRLRTTVSGRADSSRRTVPPPPRAASATPLARGGTVAAILAVDVAMFGLQVKETLESWVSAANERRSKVVAIAAFWNDFGVSCQILGISKRRGGNEEVVLRGAEEWKSIDLFPAFVSGVSAESEDNPLDQNLTDMLSLIAFLFLGEQRGALVSPDADKNQPLYLRRWFVKLKQPVREGQKIFLEDQYLPLSPVISRILSKTVGTEEEKIRGLNNVGTPWKSLARRGGHQTLAVNTGAHLLFREGQSHEVYATRDLKGARNNVVITWGPRKQSVSDSKGRPIPSFLQVGEENVGEPFVFGEALLVTGANPSTNAALYSALVQRDGDGLILDVRMTSIGGGSPTVSYTHVPMVYVDKSEVDVRLDLSGN
jgi:hypothetical protein